MLIEIKLSPLLKYVKEQKAVMFGSFLDFIQLT